MTEILIGHDPERVLDGEKIASPSLKSGPPRFEAFLMTGDKMINLNQKLSPRYAEMQSEQLPPNTEKAEAPVVRGPFDDFPSMQEKTKARRFNPETAVPTSQSENGLHERDSRQNAPSDEQHSSVTVNIDRDGMADTCGSVATASSVISNLCTNSTKTGESPKCEHLQMVTCKSIEISRSEPNSPAKSSAAIMSNFISTIRCPSPTDGETKSDVDVEASSRLARRLFALDGFRREDVAAHLSKTNVFGTSVAEEYCALFNFSGIRLDAAMRDFLSRFCLTGETQERARIIEHFAKRYHECNPTLFKSADQVHALTCALLLLNSDLHGPNVGRRMSSRDFVDNLGHTDHVFDCTLLKTLYAAIRDQPMKWVGNESEEVINNDLSSGDITGISSKERKKKGLSKSRSTVGGDDQIEYKAGWVVRKCLYDSDGKRTPFGRRGWKMVYARLRGMVLYLHKDENGFRRGRYQTFTSAILLHHSFAEKALDYPKRPHVFRLRTANLGEFLFETCDPNELKQWIDAINYVAAAFSSPALPAPVSNQADLFHKPLLPSAPSRLPIPEQLRLHEEKEEETRLRLEELRKKAPPLKAKGRIIQEFFFKERYLCQERERYLCYIEVLRDHLSALSPAHSMAIKIESYRPDLTKISSAIHTKTVPCIARVRKVNSFEQAEEEEGEIASEQSEISTGRDSYEEAIAQRSVSSSKS